MKDLVVIGQGYVGLPLSRAASGAGLTVAGLDLSLPTVDALNAGHSHIDDVSDADVRKMLEAGYVATTEAEIVKDASCVVICVPTPLGEAGRPDLSAVHGAIQSVAKNLSTGTTVILESTTYPGTTEQVLLPALENAGHVLDRDFWLAFSPERIDPGNPRYGLENTPKVVGGVSAGSTDMAANLYSRFVDEVVTVRGSKEAETAKLLENTYRHINIALVNEMVRFCHELDIDLWNVIDAAKTKPFGFQAFYPGAGVGGHCIPIDPNYLSYEVQKSLGYPFRFVELAEEINKSMPRYVLERTQDMLNQRSKAIRGSKVLLLGVTYKANIADQRESPASPVASLLHSKGAVVDFHDPRVESWNFGGSTLNRVKDLKQAVESADIVLLLQKHSEYDFDALADIANLFFDTCGVTSVQSSAERL